LTRSRLERLAHGKQLVILDGPSGYGKTTFGEQLLTAAELARARVRLRGSTDAAGLIDAVVRAFRRAGLSDLANSTEGSPDGAVDRLLAALAQRSDPVIIMIDEAQLLTSDGVDALADLASDLPPGCRLIVAGRGIPAHRFQRSCSSVVIGAADLRFEVDEVAEIIGLDPADPLIDDVVRITDRWPAAVALAGANLDSDPSWSPSRPLGERRIVETLLDQLLASLPQTTRRALSSLARLPLLDSEIVEHIGGPAAPAALVEVGLPLQRVGRWSAIPDAIRESLRGGPLEPSVARWVASHYAEVGEVATAISLLSSEGQAEAIAELLAGLHWGQLEEVGLGTLRLLLDMISDHLDEHPRALLNAVWAADRRDPVLKVAWISMGLARLPEGPARRALLAEQAIEAARSGEMALAARQAAQILAGAPAGETITRGRASVAMGMAHAFCSTPAELRKAEVVLDDAIAQFHVAQETRWEAYALERSAYLVAFKRGAYVRAAEQLEASITLGSTESRDRLTALTSYAEVLCTLGRIDEARAAATEALVIGQRWADSLAVGFAAWTLAWIAAYSEDTQATHAALQIVHDNPGPWLDQYAGHEFLVDAALMMTMIDDSCGLGHYLERAKSHMHANDDLLALLNARTEAIDGDPLRALTLLADLEGTAYADPGLAWQRALVSAVAELRSGNRERAEELVGQALRATDLLGLTDLAERFEGRLVRMLAPVWPRHAGREAKSIVHLTMFGGFSVRRGSEDCTPAAGHGATMIKLLALRGELTAERIIDALWPVADLATGRQRLRNLLNRVRSQSGDIIVRRGDSLSLHPEVVVDVTEFEKAAAEVFATDGPRRAGVARLVLGTCSGELLPSDTYEDWAAGPRERLKRRFLSLVDIVIDDSFERADLDDAVRWLDVAIAVEPLEESRYVRACEALLVQGRRATARQVAGRARAMLEDLGVAPSRPLLVALEAVDAA
jgi:DNA-binding SARP family transcriptional activator